MPDKSFRFLILLISIGLAGCSGQADPTQSKLVSPTTELASPTAAEASRVILDVFGDKESLLALIESPGDLSIADH